MKRRSFLKYSAASAPSMALGSANFFGWQPGARAASIIKLKKERGMEKAFAFTNEALDFTYCELRKTFKPSTENSAVHF